MSDDRISIQQKEVDEYSGEEKRRHVRFPVCIEVKHSGNSFEYCDYILNFSAGGVFIMTESPLPIGEHLKMEFRIPESKTLIDLEGRVVWVNKDDKRHPKGMGIELTNSHPEYKIMLEDYISGKRQIVDVEV